MSYTEQMRRLADEYLEENGSHAASAREIAAWAIRTRRWEPHPSALVRQCAEELARAMREDYFTDPQGRRVRTKHVAVILREGEQISLWADIRAATKEHMEAAFQLRRHQIIGDCRQLKMDVDSYNENFNPGSGLQLSFDFSTEVEECLV